MNATITLTNKLRGVASMSNAIINGGASPYPKHVGPAAICSFSDGAQDAPLKSLIFGIEPQQDLHGYSYPWPGGGGVNMAHLSDGTRSGQNCTTTVTDEVIEISGQANATYVNMTWMNDITIENGQSYTVRLNKTLDVGITFRFATDTSDTTYQQVSVNAGYTSAVFTANNNFAKFRIYVSGITSGTNVSISGLQILVGKGTIGSFSPYSNICPFSGWSQVDGKQSGEDMTDYTPITISLGQTVYGGVVDAIAGKLVVDRVNLSITSFLARESTNTSGVYRFFARAEGIASPPDRNTATTAISDRYKAIPNSGTAGTYSGNTGISVYPGESNIYVFDNAIKAMTLAEANAWVAANPIQVVYPLATPIEVDLTPVSVSTLLGQNNIWANTGDTELDYYPAAASVVAVLNKSSKVYTSIPLGKIRYDTYQTTPNQALDLDSYRAETGVLIRNVLSHTATKIEFNTPSMTNLQWEEVWNIIKAGFNNSTERKLKLKYYDQMSATYKTGWFYVPDVQFTIRNIDEAAGIINYDEVRVAFIEY